MTGFASLIQMEPEKVPKGWFTAWDYVAEYNTSYSWASMKLRQLLMAGKIERKSHPNPSGQGHPCYIYRKLHET